MASKESNPARYQFGAGAAQSVPRAALRFDAPDVELGDNGEGAKTAPVKLVARSGKPTQNWFWGNVVHDLSGMVLPKSKIPIDYCHDCDQVIGFANKFDTSTGDLVISGALVPYTADEDDKATEVLYKARAGVPYQASINFGGDGILLEEVPGGYTSKVNGYDFEGPGIIIRQWPLRGVAICPYGQDQNTSAEFEQGESVTVTTIKKEQALMSQQNKPAEAAPTPAVEAKPQTALAAEAAPANVPAAAVEAKPGAEAEAASKPPVTPAVEAAKPGSEFVAAFGDKGARWFLEGKQFAACAKDFITDLSKAHGEEVTALKQQVTDLQTKLDAMPRGNSTAAAFSTEGKPPATPQAEKSMQGLAPGMQRFAQGIKFVQPVVLPKK